MTKEEKIKEAWGALSNKVDENGWLCFGHSCNGWDDVEDWLESNNLNSNESYYDATYYECDNGDLLNIRIRPKSLKGIETNNSWIKIESEDDLPKEDLVYWVVKDNQIIDMEVWEISLAFHNKRNITHYQPIEKPKLPIY